MTGGTISKPEVVGFCLGGLRFIAFLLTAQAHDRSDKEDPFIAPTSVSARIGTYDSRLDFYIFSDGSYLRSMSKSAGSNKGM